MVWDLFYSRVLLPQSCKFYYTEQSERLHVKKTDRPCSEGESNIPVSEQIKMNYAINTYCYLYETSEEGLKVFWIEITGEGQSSGSNFAD